MVVQLTLIGGFYGILALTPLNLPEGCSGNTTPVQCALNQPDLQQYRLAEGTDPLSLTPGLGQDRTESQVFVLSVTEASGKVKRYGIPEDKLERISGLKAAVDYLWKVCKPVARDR